MDKVDILKNNNAALRDQLTQVTNSFLNRKKILEDEVFRLKYYGCKVDIKIDPILLSKYLYELDFRFRTMNALRNNNIHVVSDLVSMTEKEILSLSGFGKVKLEDVKKTLFGVNLRLDMGDLSRISQAEKDKAPILTYSEEYWLDRYFETTGENRQDYKKEIK
jgi:DNA-directed RNA polymerase alpha subunit